MDTQVKMDNMQRALARIEALEAERKDLKARKGETEMFLKAAMGIGGVAMVSISGMRYAVFSQTYKQLVVPGEEVARPKLLRMAVLLGMKVKKPTDRISAVREFKKYERAFKKENPRYDAEHGDFVAGSRKQPSAKPEIAAMAALSAVSLETDDTTAKLVAAAQDATFNLAMNGLQQDEPRFNERETAKYIAGATMHRMADNKKKRKLAFSGTGKFRSP